MTLSKRFRVRLHPTPPYDVTLTAHKPAGWSLFTPFEVHAQGVLRSRQTFLLARRAPTMKRIGRIPPLVLCSRNVRPEKGLVRRWNRGQHRFQSIKRELTTLPATR